MGKVNNVYGSEENLINRCKLLITWTCEKKPLFLFLR